MALALGKHLRIRYQLKSRSLESTQEMIDLGIDGFAPVIINITPLPSVLPLLGLDPATKKKSRWNCPHHRIKMADKKGQRR